MCLCLILPFALYGLVKWLKSIEIQILHPSSIIRKGQSFTWFICTHICRDKLPWLCCFQTNGDQNIGQKYMFGLDYKFQQKCMNKKNAICSCLVWKFLTSDSQVLWRYSFGTEWNENNLSAKIMFCVGFFTQ